VGASGDRRAGFGSHLREARPRPVTRGRRGWAHFQSLGHRIRWSQPIISSGQESLRDTTRGGLRVWNGSGARCRFRDVWSPSIARTWETVGHAVCVFLAVPGYRVPARRCLRPGRAWSRAASLGTLPTLDVVVLCHSATYVSLGRNQSSVHEYFPDWQSR
jgi:hypothetical protein